MAVGVAEAQGTVISKTPIGNTKAIYIVQLAFGTEYAVGGDTLASVAEPRIPLPNIIDAMVIVGSGGWDFAYKEGKIQAFGGAAAAKGAGAEAAAKQDLSAVKAQAIIIGPQ